jgi:hypothetical protein
LTSTPTAGEEVTQQVVSQIKSPPSTPTPDPRLAPDDWQDWPVVPERVNETLKALYHQGLAEGNDPKAFSKIGDCQNVAASFMGIYDRPGKYWFTSGFQFLQETIDQFSGSFDRDGQAVRGGFNVASVLSPMWADRQQCLKGETPLECEFRLTKPGIVIISMETWFAGRTADTYEKYLRQIIEFSLAHKVVPILATKADNTEGNHSINLAVARLAYEYDLPLWNFWLAVQPLEGRGLDWERDKDGFHITVEAWDKRSFTALQALDSVWKLLNEEEAPSTSNQDLQPENSQEQASADPTLIPTNLPTPTPSKESVPTRNTISAAIITPIPNLGTRTSEESAWQDKVHLVFSLGERINGQQTASGLFMATLLDNTLAFTPISAPGYRLEAISTSGEEVLVSHENLLFTAALDSTQAVLLSDHYLPSIGHSAAWLAGTGDVAAIVQSESVKTLVVFDQAGDGEKTLTGENERPATIYPTYDRQHLVWGDDQDPGKMYRMELDSARSSELVGISNPHFSSDGNHWAYTSHAPGGKTRLYLDKLDAPHPRLLREIRGYYEHLSWSPDGKWLLAIETFQSGYSGRILQRKTWLFNAEKLSSSLLSIGPSPFTHAAWAPDGSAIAFLGVEGRDGQQALRLQVLETMRRRVLTEQAAFLPWGQSFAYLDHAGWAH